MELIKLTDVLYTIDNKGSLRQLTKLSNSLHEHYAYYLNGDNPIKISVFEHEKYSNTQVEACNKAIKEAEIFIKNVSYEKYHIGDII